MDPSASPQARQRKPLLQQQSALALVSAALLVGFVSSASAQANDGPFELRIHTCASPSYAQTDDPVFLTLQADKRLFKMALDDPRKNDREVGSTDQHFFAWPRSIGGPSTLEQIKIEIVGQNGWCFDSVELRYENQKLWRWDAWQNNAGRTMVGKWPTRGAIWLDTTVRTNDRAAIGPFVRFTDLALTGFPNDTPNSAWHEALYVGTCSAVVDPLAGTDAQVDVTMMHDGIGDIITFPARTFSATASQQYRYVASMYTSDVTELSYVQNLDSVSVTRQNGTNWCMEKVGYLTYSDNAPPTSPTGWNQLWSAPRARFTGSGPKTTTWQAKTRIRNMCFPFCYWGLCTSCTTRYQGLPLKRGDFNAELAACAERAETCNGRDDNCNGEIDEGLPRHNYYRDADGDEYGSSSVRSDCRAPGGYASRTGDCNDSSAAVRPNATEACNGIDDNCNGRVDEGLLNACGQCGPVPAEVCNGLDDDCDGIIDDGFSSIPETCNGVDDNCNGAVDENPVDANACGLCGPTPVERCNGIDDDCDGLIDDAAVDTNSCGVCGPQPTELCNLQDDDCDGQVDEGISIPTTCGFGVCERVGAIACVNGAERNLCTPGPATGDDADCDGVDDDCDGEVDEHFAPDIVDCLGDCGIGFLECQGGVIVNSCEVCEG